MGYDVIGDIHGNAAKLDALLIKLGYVQKASGWVPPVGTQAIFLGDLIDRGPEQMKVVATVRRMIDAGHARSVMGNHELNAIGFATHNREVPGEYMRRHSAKNINQHKEFLQQVVPGSALHRELVDWFKTLPPILDLGVIRVVHAWWHQPYVDLVAPNLRDGRIDDEFLLSAFVKDSCEYQAMEGLTKGLEISLPEGSFFSDHDGVERRAVRTKWWHEDPRLFSDVAIVQENQRHRVPDHPLPHDYGGKSVRGSAVFIGHYWMQGKPKLLSPKVACVDYSAANNGPLVAYRWDGESVLDEKRFVEAG
jgi:hypothetical protein